MIEVYYEGLDVSPIVKSVEWSGHSEKPNRQIDVELKNTLNGRTQAIKFEKGKRLTFRHDGVQLFVGVIFASDVDELGNLNLTAYDENVYLLKSQESRKFTNAKASDIARRLCTDYGIPIGTIADTGYVIPKLIIRGRTLYDILVMALTLTQKQTGRRFFVSMRGGKFNLQSFTENKTKWVIEAGVNLSYATYSQSIEETKTRIKVTGGKGDKIVVTKASAELERLFGIMQLVEEMDEKATKAQIEQRASQLLKERGVIDDQATVTALGIADVVTGTSVYVKEPMTGIVGGFFVTGDTHTFTPTKHTMTLEISATYELPALEVTEGELGIEQDRGKRASKTDSVDEKART
jgi:hypothetical protein